MSTVQVKVPAQRKSTAKENIQAKAQVETKKEEAKMEETKTTTRKSTRQSTGSATKVQERPATKRRLGQKTVTSFWYLADTEDLDGVTAEVRNDALGIREIKVYEPSEAQWNNGTVATVTLETIIGQVKGIAVVESNRDDSLYVRMQSRSYEREGQKQYVNDLALDRKVQAQILRYVDGLLIDAE
jgi:hypothetical protein